MRILYVLGTLQHPTIIRGALRHYHILRELARKHTITLLALSHSPTPPAVVSELQGLVDRLIVVSVNGAAATGSGHSWPRRLARRIQRRAALRRLRSAFDALASAAGFDVVLFHGKAAFPVIAGHRELPTVIDFCDATSLRQRERLRHAPFWSVLWCLAGYLAARRTERQLLEHSRHVVFISSRDREAVLGRGSAAPIVPNAIDVEYWTRRTAAARENTLVFTGVMNYPPNEDAALVLIQQILPLVQRSRPDLVLQIVGLDPTPAIRKAAEGNSAVQVTGFVPDLRPYLEQATVYVAPIRYASGMQNKILEALAMGVPVVTTPAAAAGLRTDNAVPPVVVMRDSQQFANAVLALLGDSAERSRLATGGRHFVTSHFSWTRSAELLAEVCERAARMGRAALAARYTEPAVEGA